MDSVKEDEEMCPEQIDEEIVPSTRQVPFFAQRQLPLAAAASSEIATSSFASLASTGLQSLFGGCHELKQHHPNHEPMFLVYVGVSKKITGAPGYLRVPPWIRLQERVKSMHGDNLGSTPGLHEH